MAISNIATGEHKPHQHASPLVPAKLGDGITRVTDAKGRSIGVKPLAALDMFDLSIALGDHASNKAVQNQAMLAMSAVEIDGEPVARPNSMMTIRALITRLDFAGFEAIISGLTGPTKSATATVDAVKN